MSDTRPRHLFARSDDKRTLCGIRSQDDASLPHLCARFVGAHRRGHTALGEPFPLCPTCEDVALRDELDLDDPAGHDPELPGQRTIFEVLDG